MDLITTKIVVAIVFGVYRFCIGILPLKLDTFLRKWEETGSNSKTFINEKRHQQITFYVALTQSFGGGVLFATCFLHMMKELFLSVEEIENMWGVYSEYPVSQLIIAIGFFLIYFLEEFTHWIINKKKKKRTCAKVANFICNHTKSQSSSAKSTRSLKSLTKVSPVKTVATIEEWDFNEKNKKIVDFEYDDEIFNTPEKRDNPLQRTASSRSRHSIKEELDRANFAVIKEELLSPEDEESIKDQEQLMRCVLTIAALSLHSLLEGLSIGIQKFKYEIWYLFIAVSIHSASILFCMGVELILAQTRVKFIIIQVTALALASPVGILLGLLVTVEASLKTSSVSIAAVLLEGLSAGTILYITFFEVLNREKERRVYRLRRGLCIVGGFMLMALLQYSECRFEKHGMLRFIPNEGSSIFNTTVS